MNRKTKIIISITGLTIVLLALIGLTYGFFVSSIKGNTKDKSIQISTDTLDLVYGDGDSSILTGSKIDPGTVVGSKTFTVTNGGKDNRYLVILDNVSITSSTTGEPTTLASNDFVYTLTCKSSDNKVCNQMLGDNTLPLEENGLLVANDIAAGATHTYTITITYLNTDKEQAGNMNKIISARLNIKGITNPYEDNKKLLAYNIINNAIENKNGTSFKATPSTIPAKAMSAVYEYEELGQEQSKITEMSVAPTYQEYYWTYGTGYKINKTTGKFTLTEVGTCKYNDGTCNKTLVGKYLISNSASSNSSATDTTKNTDNRSDLYKVEVAPQSSTSNIKIQIRKINAVAKSAESELFIAPDDYGAGYYYRGNVKDNYVSFANKCWRVVRIEGDGSIKLILEDQDQECSSEMNGNWDIPTTTGGGVVEGNYGYTTELKDFQGRGRYTAAYAEPDDCVDRSQVYAYYNFQTSLGSNIDKLKKEDWCLGDLEHAYARTRPYNLLDQSASELLYNSTDFDFGDYARLMYDGSYKYARYRCTGTIVNEFQDKTGKICSSSTSKIQITEKADMKVGTLTADEYVIAGTIESSASSADVENINQYLVNEYAINNSKSFLLLSSALNSGATYNIIVAGSRGHAGSGIVYSSYSLRPAVVLNAGTEIGTGDGTIDSPYVIK